MKTLNLFQTPLKYEDLVKIVAKDSFKNYLLTFQDGTQKKFRLYSDGKWLYKVPKRSRRYYYTHPLTERILNDYGGPVIKIEVIQNSCCSSVQHTTDLLKRGRQVWLKAHPKLWANFEAVKKWHTLTDEQILSIAVLYPKVSQDLYKYLDNEGYKTVGIAYGFRLLYLSSCTSEHEDVKQILKELKEAIENDQPYEARWTGNYSYSLSYDPERKWGSFAAERKGLAHGHYYVLLNERTALFVEDD